MNFLLELSLKELHSRGELYQPHPPSQQDFEPWHESERSAHDQFSNIVFIMPEVQQLGRKVRKIKGHEAERQRKYCANVFYCMKRTIDARLSGWQPSKLENFQ